MKIAISPRLYLDKLTSELRMSLDTRWIYILNKIGYEVYILPLNNSSEKISFSKFDGLILSGGGDISSINNNAENSLRDSYETHLIEFCIDNKLPILGVCRGAQLINDFFGGSLRKFDNHVNQNHDLKYTKSYPKNYLKPKWANCYHNFSILKDDLSEKLEIYATSQDGSIEAFGNKTLKLLCIMWHPERPSSDEQNNLGMIEHFFNK
tara:strand:+ start:5458 stop:6081 length:624 start_codon:yes stop_codon:yes gene_type:complete